jgi:hypothetical protein
MNHGGEVTKLLAARQPAGVPLVIGLETLVSAGPTPAYLV